MKVRVLGCSGAIAKDCRTTSFLIDGDLLVDAGTGVGDLSLDELRKIDRVVLTHAHMDHIAALPLMVDAAGGLRESAVDVYALPETIEALRKHIFNDVIWPDFSRIPSPARPFIRFHPIAVGQVLALGDKQVEVMPAVHTVPAVGFAISSQGRPAWVFTGDTERNAAFWRRFNALDTAMLVIETAFSNREQDLAQRAQHLSPAALGDELACMERPQACPVYITHTKPAETELIMAEISRLAAADGPQGRGLPHDIRWLHAGQVFDL